MNEPEILTEGQVDGVLRKIISDKNEAVMSYFTCGKWHVTDVMPAITTATTFHVDVLKKEKQAPVNLQINQPVGISIQNDFNKYIFETSVIGLETSVTSACRGRIILERPDKIESVQRRAWARVAVPASMNVKVLFWHRGYADDQKEVPLENYWQGKLINLSPGGSQIAIDIKQGPNFRAGQMIGLQFTPMSYQKPLLLEGHIRHVVDVVQNEKEGLVYIGLEFIGMEASGQGRQKLRRILEIIEEYQRLNGTAGEDGFVAASSELPPHQNI